MSCKSISPAEAARLVADGALLVDIREPGECVETIAGACSAPLSTGVAGVNPAPGQPVIFHCKSGGRTSMNAAALKSCAGVDDVYLVAGGIDGWKKAGLPIQSRR